MSRRYTRKPEAALQAAILRLLDLSPQVAWAHRFNTGAHLLVSQDAQGRPTRRFVRYAFPGCADILGQLIDGRLLAIEVKAPRGRMTLEQGVFLITVNTAGGLGITARALEDVQDALFDDPSRQILLAKKEKEEAPCSFPS